MELTATVKDDDTNSDHSDHTKAKAANINWPKFNIPKFDGDVFS